MDRGRGEIVLTRNDAYWDTPTVLDQLVLRRLGPSSLAAGLATGDVDVGLPEADEAVRTALAGVVPPPRVQQAPQSSVTQLALRADTGPLRDVHVRQALGKLIDRNAVRAAVAPDALPADALGLAPSQPGYAPTAPPTVAPDPAGAAQLLTEAGWKRDIVTGRWNTADGRSARLVIGAGADRPDDVRVAQAVATQLRAAGIDAQVIAPSATDLLAQPTVAPTPPSTGPTATPTPTPTPTATAAGVSADLIVGPRAVGGDLGTELASAYGCPTATAQYPDPPRPPTGFCFSALQPLFERADVARAARGQRGRGRTGALAAAACAAALPAREPRREHDRGRRGDRGSAPGRCSRARSPPLPGGAKRPTDPPSPFGHDRWPASCR